MNDKELVYHLLNEQYKLVGKTIDDFVGISHEEFCKHRITLQQAEEWRNWAVAELKKHRRSWSAKMIEREIRWMDFQHGLAIIWPQNDRENSTQHSPGSGGEGAEVPAD